jgi:hypothetical protein
LSGQIFLLQNDKNLVEMSEAEYDSEALLQELLAKFPQLLSGEQIDPGSPRRWLLVSREQGIPDEDDGGQRWAIDHLFLDQDAIPTLVEVKRSSDTRLRREVVGQMLDYAANAVVYWPMERIQASFEARCESHGLEPMEVLTEFLGEDKEVSQFWEDVKTNLQAQKIRLLFVADRIPSELQRIIEFLNGQMDPAEVLAVEIRQFVGPAMKTLVPRVIGRTAAAQAKRVRPAAAERTEIPESEFITELRTNSDPAGVDSTIAVLDWVKKRSQKRWFRRLKTRVRLGIEFQTPSQSVFPIQVFAEGVLMFQMRFMSGWPPFNSEEKRRELQARLEQFHGWNLRGGMTGLPSIDLKQITTPEERAKLISVLDWMVDELTHKTESGGAMLTD